MLSGLFNYDNPVWRFIGKFFDIMVLNILWIICSIPLVTIGASTTAVYYVTLKLVRDEDSGTVKSFFKSFKENFKQSTIIWLILVVAGLILGFDLYFFLKIQTEASTFRTIMVAVFLGISMIYAAIFTYIFPIQSRFYNPVKKTFFNAFFMSIRHILQTIGIIAIDVGVVIVSLYIVPQLSVLLILFGIPLFAYINSFVFHTIFAKYTPEQERRDDDEMRPLFQDEEQE